MWRPNTNNFAVTCKTIFCNFSAYYMNMRQICISIQRKERLHLICNSSKYYTIHFCCTFKSSSLIFFIHREHVTANEFNGIFLIGSCFQYNFYFCLCDEAFSEIVKVISWQFSLILWINKYFIFMKRTIEVLKEIPTTMLRSKCYLLKILCSYFFISKMLANLLVFVIFISTNYSLCAYCNEKKIERIVKSKR